MAYKYEVKKSPNYTPGGQVQRFYGRPRTIELGAGHWWGDPRAGYGHQGVVNTFLNPARQGSAHDVVSQGLVTHMVAYADAAWTTSHANPYTISIEVDPRIYLRGTTAEKKKSDAIKATLIEHIATRIIPKYGNLEWKAHKNFGLPTACNPINWGAIRNAAWKKYQEMQQPEWEKNLVDIKDIKLMVLAAKGTTIVDLRNGKSLGTVPKGTWVDIGKKTKYKGKEYYISSYASTRGMPNGLLKSHLGMPVEAPVQDKPSWLDNWRDIKDQVMYLRSDAPVVNLEDGKDIKTLKQGTEILISSTTEHMGKAWGISGYSTDKKLPHGIQMLHLDTRPVDNEPIEPDPVQPPEVPKPDPEEEIPNWFIRFIKAIIEALTPWGRGKDE